MANTYIAIATVEVGAGGAAGFDFQNIPQTYTDLVLKISGRATEVDNATGLRFILNNDTANITVKAIRAIGTTPVSFSINYGLVGYLGASQSTANTFGTADIYIPNYTSSNYKSVSTDAVLPSNTAANNYATLSAFLWSSTAAVTRVTAYSIGYDWVQYSSATLYGIKNS